MRMTRSDVTRGHPEYYQDNGGPLAKEIPVDSTLIQSASGESTRATAGPEIGNRWAIHWMRLWSVSFSGPFTGLGRFFERVHPT